MSTSHKSRLAYFLHEQRWQHLNLKPKEAVEWLAGRAHHEEAKRWQPIERRALVARAAGYQAWRRVALLCPAGTGKTTNFNWLRTCLADVPHGKQMPFLLRLDRADDLHLLRESFRPGHDLLDCLAQQVHEACYPRVAEFATCRRGLERLRSAGRITLLLDGLDHVLGEQAFVQQLAKHLVKAPAWANCPIWISGRPEAFTQWSKELFAPAGAEVLRIETLAATAIGRYLEQTTGVDWLPAFPPEGRELLAIPRLLRLIAHTLTQIRQPAATLAEREEQVRRLQLHTMAGVYERAYFTCGDVRDADSQGLLAQGLRGEQERITLPFGEHPNEFNIPDRVDRLGLILGAIAFHMHTLRADEAKPEPHTTGLKREDILRAVGPKLQQLGYGTAADFGNDLARLQRMNNTTIDFLIFGGNVRDNAIVFHDRTVQAFFAAHWVTKYGSPEDSQQLAKLIIGSGGEPLKGFDEFWQFAAEMPKALSKEELWLNIFRPCFRSSVELHADARRLYSVKKGPINWIQWNRRMICHSIEGMLQRNSATVQMWRCPASRRLAEAITPYFRLCPPIENPSTADLTFMMGSPEDDKTRSDNEHYHEETVQPFWLQDFVVTNVQFEQFDPKHALWRNWYSDADHQPVLTVSYWDANSFALWLDTVTIVGKPWRVRLPREVEWEYACRAGSTTRYHWGNVIDDSRCNYDKNNDFTTSKISYQSNTWGLYDMHGNVWEWCVDRDDRAWLRVLRGGSWIDFGWHCSSTSCHWDEPECRYYNYGFRLAAVPLRDDEPRQE